MTLSEKLHWGKQTLSQMDYALLLGAEVYKISFLIMVQLLEEPELQERLQTPPWKLSVLCVMQPSFKGSGCLWHLHEI